MLCHAPDRLARRYAYQVLLLEELARGGIEVIFAKEPERSGSPEDELLRQFQGMIAEYERAQIAERCRRGKLHRARAGAVSVLSDAPYGYRYVKRTEHADAFFEIDELEAPIVREIFDRYVERRESIVQIGKSLTKQGVPTRTGTPHWGSSTIWAILRNPAYTGQAAYGRRRVTGEPAKSMRLTRQRGRHSGRSAYEHVGPEHWLRIPVPALITEEQHALAQELLERNSRLSRRNTRKPSLLQGILVCRECGHSYYRSSTRSKTGIVHHYYRCSGADSFRRPEGRVCAARQVRIDEIDEPVWAQVLALLENPELIQAEIDRRLQTLRAEHPASHRRDGLQRDLTRAQNALRRLIDGYQEQLITLEELRARMPELRRREATLRAELDALDTELHDAETYLKLTETLDAFRARLTANAETLTIEQRQEIVRLVVREVLLGDDDVTIRHSIPVPTGGQPGGSLLHSQRQSPAGKRSARCSATTSRSSAACGTRNATCSTISPSATAPPVKRRLRQAWQETDHDLALEQLDRSRSSSTTPTPAPPRSLREGMEETLTVTRLGITGKLKPTLQSTNPCESMISTVRVHPPQRQELEHRRDVPALDRRRHARSRNTIPQSRGLPRPRQPRRRDRTRPHSTPQRSPPPVDRQPHCVTITPGTAVTESSTTDGTTWSPAPPAIALPEPTTGVTDRDDQRASPFHATRQQDDGRAGHTAGCCFRLWLSGKAQVVGCITSE